MSNEKMREEFEAICVSLGHSNLSFRCFGERQGCTGCDDYEDDRTSMLYDFFKASRAALCVELPSMTNNGYDGFYLANSVKQALKEAGVKTK